MHTNARPNWPLGDRSAFDMVLKGGVGLGILATAASGTVIGWLGHPAASGLLLYSTAFLGTIAGAALGYHASRQPH